MYLKPGKYHLNDPGKSIDGPETIHRSPSAFIGGQFQLNKSLKTSRDTRVPLSSDRSPLNYSLEYRYENSEKPHQATRIGGYHYAYDANGNLSVESETPIAASGAGAAPQMTRQGDVRIVEEAWGYDHQKDETAGGYRRDFSWDSENRLKEVKSGTTITRFLYDAAGERTGKIGERGETLYFNAWFTSREDGALYRNSKHIFVGSQRAVTRLNADTGGTPLCQDTCRPN